MNDEEQKDTQQEEQQNKDLMGQLGDAGKDMAANGMKKIGKNIAAKVGALIAANLPFILILTILTSIVGVLIAGVKYIIDKEVVNKMGEITYFMIDEYCTIDESGIHFDEERMLKAIEEQLEKDKIDLSSLGLGSNENNASYEPTDNQYTQAAQYMYEYMTAAMVTEFPYIEGSDWDAQGSIKIKRRKIQDGETRDLTYIGYEKFTQMLQSTDRNIKGKMRDYFSIDESWNLCIAKTYEETINGKETQYELSEVKIPYRTMVSQYSVPMEFLMSLLQVTQSANYVKAVSELIRDTEIEFTIFDSITTTTNVYTYKHSVMDRHEVTTTRIDYYTGREITTTSIVIGGPDKKPDEVTTTIIKEDTIKANVTKAKTWIIDQTTEYICEEKPAEYPLGVEGQTNQIADEAAVPDGQTGTWKIDQSENTTITVNAFEWKMTEDETKNEIQPNLFLGLWKNAYGANMFSVGHLGMYYDYTPNGYVVDYKNPNGKGKQIPIENILGAEEWIIDLLEGNERTQVHAEIMKYLIHFYKTGEELDISELFSIFNPDEFVEGTYAGTDFDVHDESLFIKDIEELKKAFEGGYSGNQKLIQNAQAFLEMQNTYKVNALFAAAVSITETSAGRAGHAIDGHNNWFNIRGSSGWAKYSSSTEGINAFGHLIANGKYYYSQGYYTVGTIGPVYCPNTPEYPTQANSWVSNTIAQIVRFYNATGKDITQNMPGFGAGEDITVVPGDLGSLFSGGIPKTPEQMKPYLTTVPIVVNDKNGKTVTKNITVHKAVANDIKAIFNEIQASGFRAYSVGAYTWRGAAASSSRSHHSYGVAIDINPTENYMIKNGKIIAGSFWKPGQNQYSITTNGPVVRAFAKKGWVWGGTWKSSKDYMHFSLTGH